MYYAIDENAARIAHNMNSFYASSKARLLKNIGNWLMRQPRLPLKRKTVLIHVPCKNRRLLDAYSRKLADWYNKGFAIESRCPSVMIAGPSNFLSAKRKNRTPHETSTCGL